MQDTQQEKLVRQLGKLDLFCIAAGAMISSGLFVLPRVVYAKVGPAVILAYTFAGILVLPALFTKAELTTAMPRAGGSYFFIERSMGATAGTIGGFASWLSLSLKSAFSLIGIGAFATLINPNLTEWNIKIISRRTQISIKTGCAPKASRSCAILYSSQKGAVKHPSALRIAFSRQLSAISGCRNLTWRLIKIYDGKRCKIKKRP